MYCIALFSLWDTPSKYCSIVIFLMKMKLQILFATSSHSKVQPYVFLARRLNYISAEKANIIWPKTQSY